MTISELMTLASARLARLNSQRGDAERAGDVVQMATLDVQIAETERTLSALRTLTD